jgi:hypothetical protein
MRRAMAAPDLPRGQSRRRHRVRAMGMARCGSTYGVGWGGLLLGGRWHDNTVDHVDLIRVVSIGLFEAAGSVLSSSVASS